MIRLFFGLFLSVVLARWMYSEVALSFPQAVPLIDYALEVVSIPTHDKWDAEPIREVLGRLGLGNDDILLEAVETNKTAQIRQRRPLKEIL